MVVADVRFQHDPFYFMKLVSDHHLYIGRDLDIFFKMVDMVSSGSTSVWRMP